MTYRRITDISFSENDQNEGDGESSSKLQPAGAVSISGSKRAGSQENTVDDDMKQYARIQILTPENKQPPPQQPGISGITSSYWSVPEQTDFYNLLRYFGTDWQAIARSMKTKTPILVSFPLPSTAIGSTNRISGSKTFTIEKSRKAILAGI